MAEAMPDRERLARLLCLADGHDPDETVLPYRMPAIGARGHVVANAEALVPSWSLYSGQAQTLLDTGSLRFTAPIPTYAGGITWVDEGREERTNGH